MLRDAAAVGTGAWAATWNAPPSLAAATSQRAPNQARALFDEYWAESARLFPEWATFRGDHRYDDRLDDASAEGLAGQDAFERRCLERARAIRADALPPSDRVSLEVFSAGLQNQVELQAFEGFRARTLSTSFGFHLELAELLQVMPVDTAAQVESMLARLAAFPRRVEQELARLRRGKALGWVSPAPVLQRVVQQIDAQLPPDVAAGPYYQPFERIGRGVPGATADDLRARARRSIADHVVGPMKQLRAFVVDEYLPGAPADGALLRYPRGPETYEALVRHHTTTPMTAREIHAIGLSRMAALRREIEALIRSIGFGGDFAEFVHLVDADPRFALGGAEALLAGYRDIGKRIEPELPRFFAELPRIPYGVRAAPEHMGVGASAFYTAPGLDGTRPGWFNANVVDWRQARTWQMATLLAHEAVPGHHLQGARAAELADLPPFRREWTFTAYTEGWGLYAETLAREMGAYDDPYVLFGHLQMQAFRAARLVVDTGIHALQWSRQQAIDYVVENTGQNLGYITAEIDRYYSNPGQALAYMVGQMKIATLRERASTTLGERFDLRRFHQTIIDNGAVPLGVLEHLVHEWIAGRASGRTS